MHPAVGYRASLAKLDSDRVAGLIFTLVDWALGPTGVFGFEPRYRVLVCRPGTENRVGVREARTLKRAMQQLADVDRILASSTEEQARMTLGLDI